MKLTTHNPLAWIDGELATLEAADLRRRVPVREGPQQPRFRLDGRELVNFGSNDYLALAADRRLAEAAAEAARREGFGSGASPLLAGHGTSHQRLAERLAEFEGTEAALPFTSGFAANLATVAALAGPGDVVFSDRMNHASLIDGCRLSRADVRVWPHGDCDRLDTLLARCGRCRRRLVITDGLFSMDGDLAPLVELSEIARRHGAMLLVDEAHATGVFGPRGRGTAEELGVEDLVDARIGTLSKAIGCAGGFVVGSRRLVEWLIHRARPYVFSTAAPAPLAAAATAALEIIAAEPQRREGLLARANSLRGELVRQGWDVGRSVSQIIPVIVGEAARAVRLSTDLAQRGYYVPAIRPPAVAPGESRLRISLTVGHTPRMIAGLTKAMEELHTVRESCDVTRTPLAAQRVPRRRPEK